VPFAQAGDVYWIDEVSLTKVTPTAAAADAPPLVSGSVAGRVQGVSQPVAATLVDLDSDGDVFQATMLTDAAGAFAFAHVPQGSYELRITPPAGYLPPEVVQLAVSEEPNEEFIFGMERVSTNLYLPLVNR
jgi:hypothetical protein